MSRFEPYFGVAMVLLIGMSAVGLADTFSEERVPEASISPFASSTVSVLPTVPAPDILPFDIVPEATTTVASSALEKTADKKPEAEKPVPVKEAKTPPSTAIPTIQETLPAILTAPIPPAPVSNTPLEVTAGTLRNALVNIICYAPAGGTLRSISGSGIVIDPKGIILTNAHIAQYFLLTNRDVDCTTRTGNPAVTAYEASLIYISPAWLRANANVLTQATPTGTGEYDFAFLAITKSATAAALPEAFPAIPLAESPSPTGTAIVIASYGAQFLQASQIQSSLYPTVVFGSIKDVFTFAMNSIDVLALGGSAAAQEGSSGGGVADASGKLIGTITTSTVEGATDTRNLVAISASYIRSQYAREMGGNSLDSLLSQPVADAVTDFAPQIPLLESIITAQLN